VRVVSIKLRAQTMALSNHLQITTVQEEQYSIKDGRSWVMWSVSDLEPVSTQAARADGVRIVPGLDEAQDIDRMITTNFKKIINFVNGKRTNVSPPAS